MKSLKINYSVFLPPFVLLVLCVIHNFADGAGFASSMTSAYYWILNNFGWLFLFSVVVILFVCIYICFAPFGSTVIGGKDAKPMMKWGTWFSITLCTTVAAGIVFWAAAEPVQHLLHPPASSGIEPMSAQAALFSMSQVYIHWTFLPYGIYTICTVMFAFGYYNMKKTCSLGAAVSPIVPDKHVNKANTVIDIVCVFSLVAGLAASLGVAVLNINGGLNRIFGISSNPTVWAIIIGVTVGVFLISAVSGVMKGIKLLSDINVYIYYGILVLVLLFGGTVFIFSFGAESLGDFFSGFFSKALFTGAATKDTWAQDWPMFYFGNWMAWAPISAVFLGRISYGRKVKQIVIMNLVITSVFSIAWFMVISGATINLAMNKPSSGIIESFSAGYEYVIYQLFENLPLTSILVPVFLVCVFISFVTASDSTTVAISSVCTAGINPEDPDAPKSMKILWGLIIAVVTWIMMSVGEGITGVKMLSNIGGLPTMFYILFVTYSALKVARHPEKYDMLS